VVEPLDGKKVWFDLQRHESQDFWIAGAQISDTGKEAAIYHIETGTRGGVLAFAWRRHFLDVQQRLPPALQQLERALAFFRHWRRSRTLSQARMASSPVSVSTWNSCDCEPPMAPVSASTARKARPQRVKMRV